MNWDRESPVNLDVTVSEHASGKTHRWQWVAFGESERAVHVLCHYLHYLLRPVQMRSNVFPLRRVRVIVLRTLGGASNSITADDKVEPT